MTWYQTDKDTCILPLPKNASTSIRAVLSYQVQQNEITPEEALELPNRIVFFRKPIERLQSAFGQFYALELNCNTYQEFVPKNIITAFGARIKGSIGHNEYVFNAKTKAKYNIDRAAELQKMHSIQAASNSFNQQDYNRFIDYVLSGADNDHWGSQVALATHNEVYIPTHAYKLEDITTLWSNHFIGLIPTLNSHTKILVNPYRETDIATMYAADISMWGSL